MEPFTGRVFVLKNQLGFVRVSVTLALKYRTYYGNRWILKIVLGLQWNFTSDEQLEDSQPACHLVPLLDTHLQEGEGGVQGYQLDKYPTLRCYADNEANRIQRHCFSSDNWVGSARTLRRSYIAPSKLLSN